MRLNNNQRLVIAIAATAVTLCFFWRPYRDALRQMNESLLTNINSDAQAADGVPADYRFRHCTGAPGSTNRQCGPWHYDITLPWEVR